MEPIVSRHLLDYIATLFMSTTYSDFTFCIGDERIPVHKLILSSREYYRVLLYGDFARNWENEIRLEVPLIPFKLLLKYIYHGYVEFSEFNINDVLDVLQLADMYNINDMVLFTVNYVKHNITLENVCLVLENIRFLKLDELTEDCLKLIDEHAHDILLQRDFLTLSQESICAILRRESFCSPAQYVSVAVQRWIDWNPDATDISTVLSLAPSIDILAPLINFASDNLGAMVLKGYNREELLNNSESFSHQYGYTHHFITDYNNVGIIVELSSNCIINHIQMLLLWNANNSIRFNYFIEVSIDLVEWIRVINHTKYLCTAWQYLYFPARAVKYIRLVGTNCSHSNKVFGAVTLKAFQIENIPSIVDGFIVPVKNVATIVQGARVISGNNPIGLLYTEYRNTSTTRGGIGYTSGDIIVQLSQPYHIGSLRLLLWEPKSRSYRFQVKTSLDNVIWKIDTGFVSESKNSSTVLTFRSRLVLYVRIDGYCTSLDEELRCVRFECPAQPDASPIDETISARSEFE